MAVHENRQAADGHGIRVLHAFKVYKPHRGGVISAMDELVHAWDDVDSTILACISGQGFGERLDDDGVPVHKAGSFGHLMSMPLSPSFPFMFWQRARRTDVVAYHYPFPLIDLAVATHFPRDTGLVIHWHSEIVHQRAVARLLQPFMRRCLARADRVIVSTPAHIEISPLLAAVREKCDVIPFGVDSDEWQLEDAQIDAEWKGLEPFFLAAGRLVPYKGFDVLLDALAQTDARLVIVGAGPQSRELRQQAENLGISDRVRFMGGVDRHTLRCLMNVCRAFLLPSVSPNETFGIVQLEAMSCGKPIINTDTHPGIGWVARDGQEAITVRAGNVPELAAAIRKLWNDPALAGQLGSNGARRVRESFSRQQFTAKVRQVYEDVARKPRQQRDSRMHRQGPE